MSVNEYDPWTGYERRTVIFEGERWQVEKQRKHDCDLMRVYKDDNGAYKVVGREKIKNKLLKHADDGEKLFTWLESRKDDLPEIICSKCQSHVSNDDITNIRTGFLGRRKISGGRTRWAASYMIATDQDTGVYTISFRCHECGHDGRLEIVVELPPYEDKEN